MTHWKDEQAPSNSTRSPSNLQTCSGVNLVWWTWRSHIAFLRSLCLFLAFMFVSIKFRLSEKLQTWEGAARQLGGEQLHNSLEPPSKSCKVGNETVSHSLLSVGPEHGVGQKGENRQTKVRMYISVCPAGCQATISRGATKLQGILQAVQCTVLQYYSITVLSLKEDCAEVTLGILIKNTPKSSPRPYPNNIG